MKHDNSAASKRPAAATATAKRNTRAKATPAHSSAAPREAAGPHVERAVARVFGLFAYTEIMTRFKDCDVSKDADFQRAFVAFFKLRHTRQWNAGFFAALQRLRRKGDRLGIRDCLESLNAVGGGNSLDLSFASKMLSVVNPSRPIYDSRIAQWLALPRPPSARHAADERLDGACAVYAELEEKMSALLKDAAVRREIALFDEVLPAFKWVAPMKKLDFLLWADR